MHAQSSISDAVTPAGTVPYCPKNGDTAEAEQEYKTHDMQVQTSQQHFDQDHPVPSCQHAKYYQRRDLRPQTAKMRFPSTWIDKDETGNYDPAEKFRRRKRRSYPKPQGRPRPNDLLNTTDEVVDRTAYSLRQSSLILKIQFPSEASKSAFRKHVSHLPPRPHDDFANGYRLRSKAGALPVQLDAESSLKEELTRAANFPENIKGHPFARGCWPCHSLNLRCPLLDDERSWPCYTCLEVGDDCDLITSPIRKRACDRCKGKRRTCSYVYNHENKDSCEGCAADGFSCVAGPLKEAIVPRLRYERDYKKDPLPTKKPAKDSAGFMPCREAGTLCSFGKDDDQAAYVTRRTMSSVCIPQKMQDGPAAPQQPPAKPHTAAAPSKRAAHDAAKQQTPTKQPKLNEPETVSIGSKKKIISRFCHPIKFNCEDADGTDSCHFCDRSSFSIMGLEAKETEVFDWADGRGYDEVGEGHRETGSAPTRVCAACTMGRVPAIMCQKHEMQPISNVTLETMDIDGAISALFAGKLRASDQWCSVCPSLASYECQTEESMDAFGDLRCGCGLSLCELCMLSLTDEHDGDLQRMLAVLEDQPSHERPLGLRADWEFLKEDGLLMRHVLWSSK